jgi:hypothetical protein
MIHKSRRHANDITRRARISTSPKKAGLLKGVRGRQMRTGLLRLSPLSPYDAGISALCPLIFTLSESSLPDVYIIH